MIQVTIISSFSWDDPYSSNAVNIAKELSKDIPVLYVHEPLTTKSFWNLKKSGNESSRVLAVGKKTDATTIEVNNNLHIYYPSFLRRSINFLPPSWIYNKILKADSDKFLVGVKSTMENRKSIQVVILDTLLFSTLESSSILKPDLLIYYLRDNLLTQSYFKKHGNTIQTKLIQSCDLVLTNSLQLKSLVPSTTTCYFVGQGFDHNLFDPKRYTKSRSGRKIIGYIGNITSKRLNIELIHFLASSRPEYEFLMIGPEDKTFKHSSLHSLKNVTFIGPVHSRDVAKYLSGMDVTINPQLINPLTSGNYPRKIDEYLGMDKPVVAVRTPAMEIFSEVVFLEENNNKFLEAIDKALVNNRPENYYRNYALDHTWKKNASDIFRIIHQTLQNKKLLD